MSKKFTLTPDQQMAKDLVDQGKSIFLTGSGGVGKSVVVRELINKNTVLLAPTGVAAINIGGATCHSIFNLPIGVVVPSDYMKPLTKKFIKTFGINSNVERIIIDEIGMVRLDMLELIDSKLKTARGNNKPFGGIQMVFVGDFFQLESVVTNDEEEVYFSRYPSAYCFKANCWEKLDPVMVELKQVLRQEDKHQVDLLNSIRTGGEGYEDAIYEINEISMEDPMEDVVTLCSFKKTAKAINDYEYRFLKGKEVSYRAAAEGEFKRSEFPVEEVVRLKVGARVIFCSNEPLGAFKNGEQGEVVSLQPAYVTVKKDSGKEVNVHPFTWKKHGYETKPKPVPKDATKVIVTESFELKIGGNVEVCPVGKILTLSENQLEVFKEFVSKDIPGDEEEVIVERVEKGGFTQIPLLLGYGLTIHKSQGMTLPEYNLDIGWAFSCGQTYVGLSRVVDLRKIHLKKPLTGQDVKVSEEVREFYGVV